MEATVCRQLRGSMNMTEFCARVLASNAVYKPGMYDQWVISLYIALNTIVIIVSLAANLAIIIVVVVNRRLRAYTGPLMISLVAADLALAGIVQTVNVHFMIHRKRRQVVHTICILLTALESYFCIVSVLHLFFLAVERYLAICRPYMFLRMSRRWLCGMVTVAWVMPVFFTILPIMSEWHTRGLEDLYTCLHQTEVHFCNTFLSLPYSATVFFCLFLFPSAVMVFCYGRVYVVARRHSRMIQTLRPARIRSVCLAMDRLGEVIPGGAQGVTNKGLDRDRPDDTVGEKDANIDDEGGCGGDAFSVNDQARTRSEASKGISGAIFMGRIFKNGDAFSGDCSAAGDENDAIASCADCVHRRFSEHLDDLTKIHSSVVHSQSASKDSSSGPEQSNSFTLPHSTSDVNLVRNSRRNFLRQVRSYAGEGCKLERSNMKYGPYSVDDRRQITCLSVHPLGETGTEDDKDGPTFLSTVEYHDGSSPLQAIDTVEKEDTLESLDIRIDGRGRSSGTCSNTARESDEGQQTGCNDYKVLDRHPKHDAHTQRRTIQTQCSGAEHRQSGTPETGEQSSFRRCTILTPTDRPQIALEWPSATTNNILPRCAHGRRHSQDMKATRTIAVIFTCFFLFWIPFWTVLIVQPCLGYLAVPDYVWGVCQLLAYVGCMCNPFIYFFSHREVRDGLLTWCKRVKRRVSFDTSTFST